MNLMDDVLTTKLRARLISEPDVLVAYLFGSHARDSAGPLSDVDVAVLLDERSDHFRRRIEITGAVAEVTGDGNADVIVLNATPVALGYRVLRDGNLILSRDERARVRFFVHTVGRYLDMAPMRRVLSDGTRHRLAEGRFGRR